MKIRYSMSLILLSAFMTSSTLASNSKLFPQGDPELYYDMGGSGPLVTDITSGRRSYDIGGDASFGLSCMKFDGRLTISNLLNDYKGNLENVQNSILSNIKAGIMGLPMAMLARDNPRLYNLVHNNLLSAHTQFETDNKSCEQIESEAAMGGNPYQQMFQQTKEIFWKDEQENTQDVSQAKKAVSKKIKDSGIKWVGGMKGGLGQKPLNMIGDTAIAGYNILIGRTALLDLAPAPKNDTYHALVQYWDKPKDAKDWIVSVVGDETIENKSITDKPKPGYGLMPLAQLESAYIVDKLTQMVRGQLSLSEDNLELVSSSTVLITPAVINVIKNNSPSRQSLLIQKIADEMAIQNTLERALWAKKILRIGAQVPEILAIQVAQQRIAKAVHRINDEMDDLMLTSKVQSSLSSRTISSILSQDKLDKESALEKMQNNQKDFNLTDGGLKRTN